MKPLSRRDFLKVGGLAVLGTAGATTLTQNRADQPATDIRIRSSIYPMRCNKAITATCPAPSAKSIMKRMASTQLTS